MLDGSRGAITTPPLKKFPERLATVFILKDERSYWRGDLKSPRQLAKTLIFIILKCALNRYRCAMPFFRNNVKIGFNAFRTAFHAW